jgi:uncharacterized protein YgiM (DUF1202 family)
MVMKGDNMANRRMPNNNHKPHPVQNAKPQQQLQGLDAPAPVIDEMVDFEAKEPAKEESAIKELPKAVVSSTGKLRLRTGKSTESSVLDLLKPGTEVTVLSTDFEWTQVEVNTSFGKATGFVMTKFLKFK